MNNDVENNQTDDATNIPESFHELEGGLEDRIHSAMDAGDTGLVRELIEPLHYTDVSDLLERFDGDDRTLFLNVLGPEFEPEILPELDGAVFDDVIEHMGFESVAAALSELDSDDAIHLIEDLDEAEQQKILSAIPQEERILIEQGLSYPEDSAGRLMQRETVTVPTFWSVGQTIDYIRNSADAGDDILPEHFFGIFVVDPSHRTVGMLKLDQLLRTRRPVSVMDILDGDFKTISVDTDQEDVAFLFRQRDLTSAPVVDQAGRLVGTITIDDVVDVIHEEIEEDIMRMGGVNEDDLYDAVLETTRSRFSWLLVNLFTAILASVVIGFFDATIEQAVALAILMPIVASMGGNAGTQTMTVAVRALAMKELTATNASRIVGKEVLVGSINGIVFAILTGLITWFWFESQMLGVVIALAMSVNLMIAGLAGTMVPLMLDRYGFDPAVSSGVFLTTITDVVGFFAFLGLAAWILF